MLFVTKLLLEKVDQKSHDVNFSLGLLLMNYERCDSMLRCLWWNLIEFLDEWSVDFTCEYNHSSHLLSIQYSKHNSTIRNFKFYQNSMVIINFSDNKKPPWKEIKPRSGTWQFFILLSCFIFKGDWANKSKLGINNFNNSDLNLSIKFIFYCFFFLLFLLAYISLVKIWCPLVKYLDM